MALEIRAEKSPWRGTIELRAMLRDGDRVVAVNRPLEMEDATPGKMQDGSSIIELRGHEAQMLIDDLWRAGLRPSEGTGSAGQLAATERHLAHVMKTHDLMIDAMLDKSRRNDADALHRSWLDLERVQAKQGRVGS